MFDATMAFFHQFPGRLRTCIDRMVDIGAVKHMVMPFQEDRRVVRNEQLDTERIIIKKTLSANLKVE